MKSVKFSKKLSYVPISAKNSEGNATLYLVTSDRRMLTPVDMDIELDDAFDYFRFIDGRWPKESREAYLKTNKVPNLLKVVKDIRAFITELLDIEEKFSLVLALWVVGTYFFLRFDEFPYLNVNGEKDSGKTTLLKLIAGLVPYQILTHDSTPAGLYHLLQNIPIVILLDEIEGMNADMVALLNMGYKKDGFVVRAKGKTFGVYGPKVISGISSINQVTKSRCIEVKMLRSAKAKIPLLSSRLCEMAKVRGRLFVFALRSSYKVEEIYKKIQLPSFVRNRGAELVRPLASIAEYIDGKYSSTLKSELYCFFENYFSSIEKVSDEIFYAIQIIEEQLGCNSSCVKISPTLFAEELSKRTETDISPTAAGLLLSRLGFVKKRTAKRRFHLVKRSDFEKLKTRYQLTSQVSR